ncbi:hypothetical protein RchiOBHm_Chr2g0098571 [Rosa chinensis]|uniref:Uncharacterized protein n=1 Tax=Rosa chinensis TaxID=74649 RepID=A0A2P6RLM5_ROSCH|nr:hypothetical protein RchiOBHm_Chr2g0098571 [Rosa chinensis]
MTKTRSLPHPTSKDCTITRSYHHHFLKTPPTSTSSDQADCLSHESLSPIDAGRLPHAPSSKF